MKTSNNPIPLLWAVALSLLSFTACKKGWLDVNHNPNELTDSAATADLILPGLLADLPWAVNYGTTLYHWMGYWAKPQINTSGDQNTTYQFVNPFWGETPIIAPILLEEKARNRGQFFYAGIAKVIQAIMWSRNVDMLNNIPYTEAFRDDIRQPQYDSGQFIYEDLIRQLDTAIVWIKDAEMGKNIRISKADIIFHGEKQPWIQFINTLKLRLLMHQASREDRASYIQQEIQKIQTERSGFLVSGQDASFNLDYDENNSNPFYSWYSKYSPYGWPDQWSEASANITALNFLKENEDPRIAFFYEPIERPLPPGAAEPFSQPGRQDFRGNKFGLPINDTQYPYQGVAYVSHIGGRAGHGPVTPASTGILKGYDMDRWIMTSIESLFLQAEAIYRGWLPGNPEQAYKDAVKESFRWLNVGGNSTLPELSDAVFNTWYNEQVAAHNPNVSWLAAPDQYKLLMFQKYMAFNGIEPFEAYVDYRRNGGYPDIPLSAAPNRVGNKMPIRSLYDRNEYENNTENVNAQGEIDVFNSKIWWMP